MRKVFPVASRVLLCGIVVLVIGRSAVLSQGASNAAEASRSPEITDHFRRMLRYHLRMDGNVPDGAVVFIGDSLTQGLCTDAVACPSVNYGIGSDTTVGVLERLPNYRCVSRASAVVLAIGSNDLDRRDDAEIIENFRRILAAVPQAVPVVCSAVLPVNEPLLPASDRGANARISGLNAKLKALCEGGSRCVFVDAGPRLIDSEGNLSATLQDGDGVHLNCEGNRIWIEELRAAVRTAQSLCLGEDSIVWSQVACYDSSYRPRRIGRRECEGCSTIPWPPRWMKNKPENNRDELRPEYDLDYSKAVRGKYYKRLLQEGANVVVLEPDVAKAFGDSAAVNEALRSLLDISRSTQRLTKRSAGRKTKTARR